MKPTNPFFHTSFHHHPSDATTKVALRQGHHSNVFLTGPKLASSIRLILSFFPSILNADSYNFKKKRVI